MVIGIASFVIAVLFMLGYVLVHEIREVIRDGSGVGTIIWLILIIAAAVVGFVLELRT